MSLDLIGKILAALLTLMVFSYLLGNNPLYRLAQHIFVGVAVGYAMLLLLGNILVPQVLSFRPGTLAGWLVGLPILLGLLLLFRLVQPVARAGRPQVPLLLGLSVLALNIAVSTAAALAIGGALTGTIVPQLANTMRRLTPDLAGLSSLVVVLGVIASLYYFQFSVRAAGTRSASGLLVAGAGRWLILIALGATLGALTVSFVSALVERVDFLFSLFNLF